MVEGISELRDGVLLGERYRLVRRAEVFSVGADRVAGVEYEYWVALDESTRAEVWIQFAAAGGVYADGAALAGSVAALRRINHPAVPAVHAFGEYEFEREGALLTVGYCAIPAVEAETLAAALVRETLDRAEILLALGQVAEVLQLIGEFELVHGHLSARSVLLAATAGPEYDVVVADLPASLALETAVESDLTSAADVYALAWLTVLALIGPAVLEAEFGAGFAATLEFELGAAQVVEHRRAWAAENLEVLGVSAALAAVLLRALGEASERPRVTVVAGAIRRAWVEIQQRAAAGKTVAAQGIAAVEAADVAAVEVVEVAEAAEAVEAEQARGTRSGARKQAAKKSTAKKKAAETAAVVGAAGVVGPVAAESASAAAGGATESAAAAGTVAGGTGTGGAAGTTSNAGAATGGAAGSVGPAGTSSAASGVTAAASGTTPGGVTTAASGAGAAGTPAALGQVGVARETVSAQEILATEQSAGAVTELIPLVGGGRRRATPSGTGPSRAATFGAPAGDTGGSSSTSDTAERRSRRGVFIGAGAGIAVIVIILVIVFTQGSSPKSNVAASSTPTAATGTSAVSTTTTPAATESAGSGGASSGTTASPTTGGASVTASTTGSGTTATSPSQSVTFPATLETYPATPAQALEQIKTSVAKAQSELSPTEIGQLGQITDTLEQELGSGQSLSTGTAQLWALLHSGELPGSFNNYLGELASFLSASGGS